MSAVQFPAPHAVPPVIKVGSPTINLASGLIPIPEKRVGFTRKSSAVTYPFSSLSINGNPIVITFDPHTLNLPSVLKREASKVFSQASRFIAAHPEYEFTIRTIPEASGAPAHRLGIWRVIADPAARAAASAARKAALARPESVAKRAARKAAKLAAKAAVAV